MQLNEYRDVRQFLQSIFYDEVVYSYEGATEAFFIKIMRADRKVVLDLIRFCEYALDERVDDVERQNLWVFATGGDFHYDNPDLANLYAFIRDIAQKELQRRSMRSSLVKRKK